jgi:PAS domain S-box-containing protein
MMTSRISKLKIGPRLILCFALIILLMLVGNTLLAWQFRLVNQHSDRVSALARELVVVSRFQTDLLSLDAKLDSLAKSEDLEGMKRETRFSRPVLVSDIEAIRDALVHLPSDVWGDTATRPTVEAVETTLSPQLDAVIALGAASDWNAVRLRLADEKRPLEAKASDLVRNVQKQVSDQLVQSVAQSERVKARILLILPLTAFVTLILATLLGTSVTRSIIVPLNQLLEGSTALARGDFDYQVQLRGKDELAHVGTVFNQTSAKLGELYRKLEEAQRITHVGYWERDLATNHITWSDETYRIFGLRPQEHAMDLDALRLKVHPEDWEFVSRALNEALAGGPRYNLEYRLLRPTGELRIVHSEGDVMRDASGRPYQMFGTVQDITDRKRAEEALRRSEFYLREGERLAHIGSWAFNTAGFGYWSSELFQIHGLDPSGKPPTVGEYLDLVHPEDRGAMGHEIQKMLADHLQFDYTKRIVRPDGEIRYVRCVGIPVIQGQIFQGFLGTGIDVTEQELLTQELERQQAYLTEAQKLTHTGSWVWNVGTDERFWSEETFRIFEVDPVKVKPDWPLILDRVHPDDRASLEQRKNMESTETEWTESKADFRIVVPDGKIKHLHYIAHPVMDASGRIIEVLGTTMDVTERKRVEDSLRRSESHLAEAQRLTHTGSWVLNVADRKLLHLSEEWYRIFGFDPAEGAPPWEKLIERIHPDDRPQWKSTLEWAIVEKADYDGVFRIVLPEGVVRWIHTVGHPVLTAAGELVQLLGSSTNITERKSAEQERERLRQLEEDLAHINRVSMMGEMAASLAHEIKQPIAAAMTSANSCIEWLAHEPPNLDRARAAAAKIDKYGNRAAEIIDHVRSLYRKSPPQRELIDVNEIVQEIFTLLQGEAIRYSIAMRSDLAGELPKIKADQVQLQQVFMNLMLNAIEAMRDEGGELTVKSQRKDSQLLFSVSDTGPGLPAGNVEQIFSAFFTTKLQGSGMGLAISRSIVESHGGRLWATANDGRGATFHFTLPTEVTKPRTLVT